MRNRLTDRMEKIAAGGTRREISDDFKYDKRKLKHLKHILHNVTVALGTLVSALNEFSRFKGPDVSPDGLIGGLGYIVPLKDIKEALNNSIRSLSDTADSLADELHNPHWEADEDKEVKKLIKDKEEVEEKIEDVGEGVPSEEEVGEEEEKPEGEEEKPEGEEELAEEGQEPEKEEESEEQIIIEPKDVITSQEYETKKANIDKFFEDQVKSALVRFSSVGTKKTNS